MCCKKMFQPVHAKQIYCGKICRVKIYSKSQQGNHKSFKQSSKSNERYPSGFPTGEFWC